MISARDYDRRAAPHGLDVTLSLSRSPHRSSAVISQRLSILLSRSPHLANYIRTLDLPYNTTAREAYFVPQILSAVTRLTTLILKDHFCAHFPLGPSIVSVFSLPSLWSVQLDGYSFESASDLESLLSKAKSLRALALRDVVFDDSQLADIETVLTRTSNQTNGVKLETLRLNRLNHSTATSMLDVFTAVDIRHLKSLSTHDTPAAGLLQANARSIQKLKWGNSLWLHW
ncbi:hypothetical protein C8R45DRAFT_936700 [Mycena sanguinolenta]|nr:hypothetical protein C8R45DRAFT_936700 [Mycena sanguinolenta]